MDKAEITKMLKNTAFFSVVSEAELDEIAGSFEEVSFKLGSEVCKIGQPGDSFYVLYSGRARAVGKDAEGQEITLDTLTRGDHFGEQALLTGEPWDFTVRASANLILLRLSKERFFALMEKNPGLKHYFDTYVSDTTLRNFMKQCTVFSPISPDEMRGFLDAFAPKAYRPGEVIVEEGEAGDSFYLIRDGEVEVVKESQGGRIVNRLGAGDFFGELALLTGEPRAATVRAKTPVTVFRLGKDDFDRLIQEIPQIRDAILGVAAGYSSHVREMLTGVKSEMEAEKEASEREEPAAAFARCEILEEEEPADEEERFVSKRRRRYPMLLQQSIMDCGAACLAMIARYYGLNISINRAKELANVTREGATLYSLAEAAESLGFRAKGVRAGYEDLLQMDLPAIAHWEGYHYIVLYRATADKVVVADPATGIKKLSREEFMKGWTGTLLLLTPTPAIEKVEPSRSTFARFYPFILAHKKLLMQIFIASLIIQVLGLAVPLFTQNIVDRVLVQQDMQMLNLLLLGMLVITGFQVATTALRQYMLVFTMRRIDLSMLVQFYNHVLRLPLKYFEDRKVGDIITRLKENEKIRELLTGTTLSVIMDSLTVIVYITLMFYYNVRLTLLVLAFIPLFALFTFLFTPMMKKNSREVFQAGAESQSYMVESITGINTVKALAVEKPVRWKWEEMLQTLLDHRQKGAMINLAAESTGKILQILSTVFILWYGAVLVMGAEITIGQLMAFNILLGSVIGPVVRIVGLWDQFQEARVALERVNDVLEAELEPGQNGEGLVMPAIKGHVYFKNVTFRYHPDGKNVLQNITLEVIPGQTVALVGRSGSGKTTLTNLLFRLHQPTEGEIHIDGVNIRHVSPVSLRRQMGVVLQENFLFSGTIQENIALGVADPPLQDVMTAAMLAGAHDFISELPMGYDTVVGERGMSLSGGQRQRIAIARALFNRPRVLILDEATSALDTESEKIIQENLENILHDRTTFIIAHRLSTVRSADLIVVLDRGVIVEKGTHYELMEAKGLYFYLNSQQLQI